MRSRLPKLLHPLCGRPMIGWSVAAASEAGAGKVVVVQGPGRELEQALDRDVEFAIQAKPLGTGDAVKAAAPQFDGAMTVIVVNGDHPLISPVTLRELAEVHERPARPRRSRPLCSRPERLRPRGPGQTGRSNASSRPNRPGMPASSSSRFAR